MDRVAGRAVPPYVSPLATPITSIRPIAFLAVCRPVTVVATVETNVGAIGSMTTSLASGGYFHHYSSTVDFFVVHLVDSFLGVLLLVEFDEGVVAAHVDILDLAEFRELLLLGSL